MTTVESISQPERQLPQEESGRGPSEPLLGLPVAVILAAGSGSRLGGVPKPLARVAGVTLLERAVSTFRSAGVERVVVVVGHARASVRSLSRGGASRSSSWRTTTSGWATAPRCGWAGVPPPVASSWRWSTTLSIARP